MGARLHSWWQRVRKPLEIFFIIVGCVLVIALLVMIALAYILNMNIPGLRGKTLWDWLQLLIIPAVLAVGGYLFNYTASRNEQETTKQRDRTERDIASDNQREAALQAYIDKISELLLEKHLRESQPQDEVRTIARVRTLTTLPRLDKERKGSIIQFLHEFQLIAKDNKIIDLEGANLTEAYLVGANLTEVGLNGADLSNAQLVGANLTGADLSYTNLTKAYLVVANLTGANLRRANLTEACLVSANLSRANLSYTSLGGANLTDANLTGATVVQHQLDQTLWLTNAIMPDGSKHP